MKLSLGDKIGIGMVIFWVLVVLFILSGWIMNISDIISLESIEFKGEHILRIIGIFLAPIGAIMGWFF